LHGVEKKLALGRYPDVSLSQARKARDAAREAVSKGIDPALAKRPDRIVAKFAAGRTFGDVAGSTSTRLSGKDAPRRRFQGSAGFGACS
jgi:hypothetical protein